LRKTLRLAGPICAAKRLQLLREAVPQLPRVAVLWHPRAYSDRTTAGMTKEAALLQFDSVLITVSTICRISFVCAQARIEAE
jgi:hypothetical protein